MEGDQQEGGWGASLEAPKVDPRPEGHLASAAGQLAARMENWVDLVSQLVFGRPGFNPCVGRIPWRRERLPTPVFLPG